MKRQNKIEKIIANHVSDRAFRCKICREHINIEKKTNNLI